jgi:hypothetical protein
LPKFTFNPEDLKQGFALARIVKSEAGDFCIKFTDSHLVIFTSDRRRYVRVQVSPKSMDGVPDGYKSDEFFLLSDRAALFDSELESVVIGVNQNSLNITTSGGGQTRQATLKRKSTISRRAPIPARANGQIICELESNPFEELLRQISCSALIKETKTDEARRVNQVHFYPEKNCAVSNARYFGSAAFLPGLEVDLSIVSDDLPLIKSFCAKCKGNVRLSQDTKILYIIDCATDSILALSKVASNKPPLALLDDNYPTIIEIDRHQILQALRWACLALAPEGTSRLTLNAENETMQFLFGQQEISQFPIAFLKGKSLRSDYNAKYLSSIVEYLEDGKILMKHGNPASPTILEFVQAEAEGIVRSKHYLQYMRVH